MAVLGGEGDPLREAGMGGGNRPMAPITLRIRRERGAEDLPRPRYQSALAAGMDLYAAVPQPVRMMPAERCLIPTGIRVAIPAGYEGEVRPRSGLALHHGIGMVNTPGTIDADYRGEVRVLLINHGHDPFTITRGMRIAQLVIAPVARAEIVEVDELAETDRGDGGFGHTGGH